MSPFVPGLELARRLHEDHVAPVLARDLPGVPYASALVGRGSEVLGFDDETSTDHDWGARAMVFTARGDDAAVGSVLASGLPSTLDGRPVLHEVHVLDDWVRSTLGIDRSAEPTVADWLTFPEHVLAGLVGGEVFHDEVGIRDLRGRLAHYPRDVRLYLLLAGWWRVHPEANLSGRAGDVGDDLGSRLIASRLVTDLMRLCFLMERRYAPYPKWFGTAFARLECGPALTPLLDAVLGARTWQEREQALLLAYAGVAAVHDSLGITPSVRTAPERMWDRPYAVLWGDFPEQVHALIRDPAVLALVERWPIGPVDRLREWLVPGRRRTALLRLLEDPTP